jgi:hypothetical protein
MAPPEPPPLPPNAVLVIIDWPPPPLASIFPFVVMLMALRLTI